MTFSNGKEMLDIIQSGTDLYCPYKETYVFLYGEESICHYDWINKEHATHLATEAKASNEYWGAFLGVGGHIEEDGDELDWCERMFHYAWIDTKDWEED